MTNTVIAIAVFVIAMAIIMVICCGVIAITPCVK